jgi:hypothetical protein
VVTSSADQTSRHASTSRFHLTQSQWGCAMLGNPHDLNEGVINTSQLMTASLLLPSTRPSRSSMNLKAACRVFTCGHG